MLETRHLSVTYGSHRALEDVNANVGEKEICVILGANGAGKSTLLKAIGGVVRANGPTEITKDGRPLRGLKASEIVEAGIALVPEGRGIFGDLTVAENLELGAYARRARGRERRNREMVLDLFPKLAERRRQVARTMSGGEQQMVAIGRALMSSPDILMLDEPSLGLSPILSTELFKTLKEIRGAGVGILLVEQNARLSLAVADRGYLLENGHLAGEDRAERLANDPAVQRAYLGGVAKAREESGQHQQRVSYMASYSSKADALPGGPATIDELVARANRVHAAHVEAKRASSPVPSAFRRRREGGGRVVVRAPDLASRADQILKAHVAEKRAARLNGRPAPASVNPVPQEQTTAEPAREASPQATLPEAGRMASVRRKDRKKLKKLLKKLNKLMGD